MLLAKLLQTFNYSSQVDKNKMTTQVTAKITLHFKQFWSFFTYVTLVMLR